MTTLTLNRRLASLLGWTSIIENGGALLGTPPPGEYCVRNQCRVPDWAGDWRDCGPLLGKYEISIEQSVFCVEAKRLGGAWVEVILDGIGRDEATLRAIVLSLVGQPEAGNG